MDSNRLAELFSTCLDDPVFQETLALVKANSRGKIWIIGGFVYRNIAAKLYGGSIYNYDIDFIVEEKNEKLKEVEGWKIEANSYQNLNYVREGNKMSFMDIRKAIRVSGMTNPTIEAFIAETPLTMQSIAYDMDNARLIGDMGIDAIIHKTVRVNNLPQAEFYAKRKGKNLETLIQDKAKELGFEAVV